jgi:hypothetical protein
MAVPPADRPCAVIREGAAGNVAGLCVFIAQDLLSACWADHAGYFEMHSSETCLTL